MGSIRKISIYFKRINHKACFKIRQNGIIHETFLRSAQTVYPTGTLLWMFYVWQLRIKLLKVLQWQFNGDSILPSWLTWVMIYSFGINADFVNRS